MHPEVLLKQLFETAYLRADPSNCLATHLQSIDHDSIHVLALGKSATQMAAVAQQVLGDRIRSGLAVTADNHSIACGRIKSMESRHPVPDQRSVTAATGLLQLAEQAGADDVVLMLLSGGGSSLACAPTTNLDLATKQNINQQLLKSGADINEINTLRKHLSKIKGGRLTIAAQPARVITLAISDVPEDSPQSIASGPTLPDDSTCADCLAIIARYALDIPDHIIEQLQQQRIETPKQTHPAFTNHDFQVIASPAQALQAAAKAAQEQGYNVINLGADWYQDAEDIAQAHYTYITEATAGTLILSGGEASVTVTGSGQGGRNGQFLLALACLLDAQHYTDSKIWALAADTDGIDGRGDNAGCLLTPDTIPRARAQGLDPQAMLRDNNSYPFFAQLNNLLHTGPTGTNVNDFRAIVLT